MNQKYKIIFDTNIIWLNDEDKVGSLFNYSIHESIKFLQANDLSQRVFLAIPEIVKQERVEQILTQIENIVAKVKNGLISLSAFGVKNAERNYNKKYRLLVNKRLNKFLNGNKIEVIRTPKFDQKDMIGRCVKKIKPFNGAGDKGFKDTLIWLSILRDAQKNNGLKYILCTNNIRDFDKDELINNDKTLNNESFFVVKDLSGLKQFLDTKFNLDLELKAHYAQVENAILTKIGEIMIDFNKQNVTRQDNLCDSYTSAMYTTKSLFMYEEKERTIGYDFIDITIQDINESKNENYDIQADLAVKPRTLKEETALSTIGSHYFPSISKNEIYSITLLYNKKEHTVELLSSYKTYKTYYAIT